MADEEFELMPRKQIKELKKEIDNLKKSGNAPSGNAKDSMEQLTVNLNEMLKIFKEATDSMKIDEEEEKLMATKMGPITEKLDILIDQNKKIAEGIIAVADMVEEKLGAQKKEEPKEEPKPRETPPSFGSTPPFGAPSTPAPNSFSPPGGPPSGLSGPPPAPMGAPPIRPMGNAPPMPSQPSMGPPGLGNLPEPPSAAPPPPRKKGFLDRFK